MIPRLIKSYLQIILTTTSVYLAMSITDSWICHQYIILKVIDMSTLVWGPIVKDPMQNGKFRVPTLRNIALTAPYGHNGYFNTLEEIVHFYNVRDDGKTYPHPEYPATVNHDEMGNLGLTPAEEADIVAFLKTLTDGYTPAQDKQ
jgi:cytochrome c peroxidase